MEVWGDAIFAVTLQPCNQSPLHFCMDDWRLQDRFTFGYEQSK